MNLSSAMPVFSDVYNSEEVQVTGSQTRASVWDMQNIYQFTVADSNGKPFSMEQHAGKLILIVNVASKCGYTPQYDGLEKLFQKYKGQGLMILGFPCNQFGSQEPGTDAQIQEFCQLNYGVSFPVLKKIDVNGAETDPLYKWLKNEAPGVLGTEAIKWNFTKFLVSKAGIVLKRYAPTDTPESLEKVIQEHL